VAAVQLRRYVDGRNFLGVIRSKRHSISKTLTYTHLHSYDIGILSTIYVSPGFKKALNNPSSDMTGLITAIFSVGQLIGFVFLSGRTTDRFGRRYAGIIGVSIVCVGAALQTGAVHHAMMILGRVIAGIGTGIVSTTVPLYLSEAAPAAQRGFYVAINQVGIVFG
jgi:MFS family permease